MRWAWTLLLLAACDQGVAPLTCNDAVQSAGQRFEMRRYLAEQLIGDCELSSWSAQVKRCLAHLNSELELDRCNLPRDLILAERKELTARRTQMCACKDKACADRVRHMPYRVQRSEIPALTDDETHTEKALIQDAFTCWRNLGGTE